MIDTSLNFAFAWGQPTQAAGFRIEPEDFIVDEQMAIELEGSGEHFWLHIKKRGENTEWVAKKLAAYFAVKKMDVGYAGKKDRHAVTSQWFSIYLPGKEHQIDWPEFLAQSELNASLLNFGSHTKKLRLGEHKSNQFVIRLHGLSLDQALETKLENIKHYGVPNYFGEQRFGRDAANLDRVQDWVLDLRSVRNRNQRSILMSSARSYLFNLVASARVHSDTWQKLLAGDPESSPSGPLWGRGRSLASEETLALEDQALKEFDQWRLALENVGLKQQRRSLSLQPLQMSWRQDGVVLELSLELTPGQFATTVLRELAILEQPER